MRKTIQPNPQGKGLPTSIGFMQELETGLRLLPLEEDSSERILEDYINSLVALSCHFKFKPVIGKTYYMYLMDMKWVLSLVAPDEGGSTIFEKFIACCRIREDTTWKMKFVNGLDLGKSILEEENFNLTDNELRWTNGVTYCELNKILSKCKLGRYRKNLGYYQNGLHFTLSKVIKFRTKRLLELDYDSENSENQIFLNTRLSDT